MPSWQAIIVFCFAAATTLYFKFALPEPASRDDGAFDGMESRAARLERFRMEHGACVHCGEQLARRAASMLPASVCPHCGRDPGR